MGSSKPELMEAVAETVAWMEHGSFDEAGSGVDADANADG